MKPCESNNAHNSTLYDDLLLFMLIYNVSRRGMQHLLDVLRRHNVDVPKSIHSLKKDCNKHKFAILDISRGSFAYSSIIDNVTFCIKNNFLVLKDVFTNLTLQINVDGLPLFKSSQKGLLPILMMIKHCKYPKPLPLAVFCGVGKPPLNEFICKLVEAFNV